MQEIKPINTPILTEKSYLIYSLNQRKPYIPVMLKVK